jgi:hypothetical protein
LLTEKHRSAHSETKCLCMESGLQYVSTYCMIHQIQKMKVTDVLLLTVSASLAISTTNQVWCIDDVSIRNKTLPKKKTQQPEGCNRSRTAGALTAVLTTSYQQNSLQTCSGFIPPHFLWFAYPLRIFKFFFFLYPFLFRATGKGDDRKDQCTFKIAAVVRKARGRGNEVWEEIIKWNE